MKKNCLMLVLFVLSIGVFAQDNKKQQDSTTTEKLDEVLVKAVRVNATSPITHSSIERAAMKE